MTEIVTEYEFDKEFLEEMGLELLGYNFINNEKIFIVRKKKKKNIKP